MIPPRRSRPQSRKQHDSAPLSRRGSAAHSRGVRPNARGVQPEIAPSLTRPPQPLPKAAGQSGVVGMAGGDGASLFHRAPLLFHRAPRLRRCCIGRACEGPVLLGRACKRPRAFGGYNVLGTLCGSAIPSASPGAAHTAVSHLSFRPYLCLASTRPCDSFTPPSRLGMAVCPWTRFHALVSVWPCALLLLRLRPRLLAVAAVGEAK